MVVASLAVALSASRVLVGDDTSKPTTPVPDLSAYSIGVIEIETQLSDKVLQGPLFRLRSEYVRRTLVPILQKAALDPRPANYEILGCIRLKDDLGKKELKIDLFVGFRRINIEGTYYVVDLTGLRSSVLQSIDRARRWARTEPLGERTQRLKNDGAPPNESGRKDER